MSIKSRVESAHIKRIILPAAETLEGLKTHRRWPLHGATARGQADP